MNPFSVDVSDIAHDLGASIEIDVVVESTDLAVGERLFSTASPAVVRVSVTNAGDGIVALGTIQTDFTTECSRCLEPFTFHVTGEVEGFYTTPEKAKELPDDQEWEPLGEHHIDISHALEAALRIELPFVPLHDESCQGICPTCGIDLNTATCDCAQVEVAQGPFAALKNLLVDESSADG